MKTYLVVLGIALAAILSFIFGGLFFEDDGASILFPAVYADSLSGEEPSHRRSILERMGLLEFGQSMSLDELGVKIMTFLGLSIIYVAILGVMTGGSYLVFAGGNERRAQKGKEIVVASIIGLVITLSSYLIVKFVQLAVYGV